LCNFNLKTQEAEFTLSVADMECANSCRCLNTWTGHPSASHTKRKRRGQSKPEVVSEEIAFSRVEISSDLFGSVGPYLLNLAAQGGMEQGEVTP
jgi:hypothetical protein